MDDTIDITGIDKIKLIKELYNGTRASGLGMLHNQPGGLSDDQARAVLDRRPYDGKKMRFDYVHGRPFKLDMDDTKLYGGWLYDRDAGAGACQRAVDRARG